jgi:hypothetical protein
MLDDLGRVATVSDDDGGHDTPKAPSEVPVLRRGATLGRYIVLDPLGEGGMGVVYAAYDPELDRKLAVKVLRDRLSGAVGRSSRLLREAQALARLDHPNVVAVYDVGTIDGQVFIAMELVAGQTIGAWLEARPRDGRAIVEVYRLAGHGLAAAHALGIVHRDFKPENVLIDSRGRVRVVDFGLARTAEDAEDADNPPPGAAPDPERSGGGARVSLAVTLTRTGAIVGTPGYIAPEQEHGKTQPAVDQFSFCVALWKALYGELPYAGKSGPELAAAAKAGEIRAPSSPTRVPAWLHRILLRGLSRGSRGPVRVDGQPARRARAASGPAPLPGRRVRGGDRPGRGGGRAASRVAHRHAGLPRRGAPARRCVGWPAPVCDRARVRGDPDAVRRHRRGRRRRAARRPTRPRGPRCGPMPARPRGCAASNPRSARARSLAEQAERSFHQAGARAEPQRREVAAWLAAHVERPAGDAPRAARAPGR